MPPTVGIFIAVVLLTAGSIPAGILLAIPSNKIASRIGQSPALFTVLALIPLLNLLFFFVMGILVLLHILDRLNAIEAALTSTKTQGRQ